MKSSWSDKFSRINTMMWPLFNPGYLSPASKWKMGEITALEREPENKGEWALRQEGIPKTEKDVMQVLDDFLQNWRKHSCFLNEIRLKCLFILSLQRIFFCVLKSKYMTRPLQELPQLLLLSLLKAQSKLSCLFKSTMRRSLLKDSEKTPLIYHRILFDNPIILKKGGMTKLSFPTPTPLSQKSSTLSPDNSFPAGSTQPLFIFYTLPLSSLSLGVLQLPHLTHYAR